jgi:hypothetical protein
MNKLPWPAAPKTEVCVVLAVLLSALAPNAESPALGGAAANWISAPRPRGG